MVEPFMRRVPEDEDHDMLSKTAFSKADFRDLTALYAAAGLRPPKQTSATKVRRQVKKRAPEVFKFWKLLNDILDRHEATIRKRWAKKTKLKRQEILLSAWPNMAQTHRPDFAASRKQTDFERQTDTKFRDAYIWPYINLEDLSKPKTLPIFLNARARNSPGAFAIADNNAVQFGYSTRAVPVEFFLDRHTMMFPDRKTIEGYGELIAWDDNDNALEWMFSGLGVPVGDGLIILEIQERIMRFLVDFCKQIMHDIAEDRLVSDDYPKQPQLPLPTDKVEGLASLAAMAAESPYRPPANLDLARLESLFEAKVAAAEDHIWSLREDPGYFADTLHELNEHRPEIMKSSRGQKQQRFQPLREAIYSRVIYLAVTWAYTSLEVWSVLLSQVKDLQKLQAKHAANITPGKSPPKEYLDALLRFRRHLIQASKEYIKRLQYCGPPSPGLREFYTFEACFDPTTLELQTKMQRNLQVKSDKVEEELIWLLRVLMKDDAELHMAGMINVMDELERLIQSQPSAQKMISAFLAEIIGDLAITNEGLRQLDLYQARTRYFDNIFTDRGEEIENEFAESTKAPYLALAARWSDPTSILRLLDSLRRKLYYPSDKRRTKENVEAMQRAEQDLDAFWTAVDHNLRSQAGDKVEGTALWKLLSQERILERTSPWVEPDKKGKTQPDNAYVEALQKPLSELYFELEHRSERTMNRDRLSEGGAAKVKTKTRGKTVSPTETRAGLEPPPQSAMPDVQTTTFFVNARALKVFRTIFHTPSVSATPGEVAWTDFLYAMVSIGFSPEKLYGSHWQFHPTDLDVERSIQFHEPHPIGKLPYRKARRIGRRLEREYGWFGAMFQLAERTKTG